MFNAFSGCFTKWSLISYRGELEVLLHPTQSPDPGTTSQSVSSDVSGTALTAVRAAFSHHRLSRNTATRISPTNKHNSGHVIQHITGTCCILTSCRNNAALLSTTVAEGDHQEHAPTHAWFTPIPKSVGCMPQDRTPMRHNWGSHLI